MNTKRWARLGGRRVDLEMGRLGELTRLFKSEGDRGAALLGAAYAEQALELAIRSCLIQDKEVDALFDESRGGPLSTLSSKIKMAFALGILTDVSARDLDLVRDVRNDFAHHPDEVTFESPSIRDRCDATATGVHIRILEAESGKTYPRWSSRELYLNAICLAVATLSIHLEGKQPPAVARMTLSIPLDAPRRRRTRPGAPRV